MPIEIEDDAPVLPKPAKKSAPTSKPLMELVEEIADEVEKSEKKDKRAKGLKPDTIRYLAKMWQKSHRRARKQSDGLEHLIWEEIEKIFGNE